MPDKPFLETENDICEISGYAFLAERRFAEWCQRVDLVGGRFTKDDLSGEQIEFWRPCRGLMHSDECIRRNACLDVIRKAFSSKSNSAARAICWPMVARFAVAWQGKRQIQRE